MQKRRKILRGRKDTLAPVVSTLRGQRPAPSPRRSDASANGSVFAHGLRDATLVTSSVYSKLFLGGGGFPPRKK